MKPKKRRSLRNLLRSKIPADEAVVSYPVNPKEDEAAYSAIGQKLANHSCESLSGYWQCDAEKLSIMSGV